MPEFPAPDRSDSAVRDAAFWKRVEVQHKAARDTERDRQLFHARRFAEHLKVEPGRGNTAHVFGGIKRGDKIRWHHVLGFWGGDAAQDFMDEARRLGPPSANDFKAFKALHLTTVVDAPHRRAA